MSVEIKKKKKRPESIPDYIFIIQLVMHCLNHVLFYSRQSKIKQDNLLARSIELQCLLESNLVSCNIIEQFNPHQTNIVQEPQTSISILVSIIVLVYNSEF